MFYEGALTNFINEIFRLPLYPWRMLIVFGTCYFFAITIFYTVTKLAVDERLKVFKTISPGVLPPLGVIFGLLLVFSGNSIWVNYDKAKETLYQEAGALRSILLLARSLPSENEKNMRNLVDTHIEHTIKDEWPKLIIGHPFGAQTPDLMEAYDYTLSLKPQDNSLHLIQQKIIDKWDIVRASRRERIFISRGVIHPIKIGGLTVIIFFFLTAVAFVHCDNKKTCALALFIFSSTIGMSMFLLAAYSTPFSGKHGLASQEILKVIPASVPCRCET